MNLRLAFAMERCLYGASCVGVRAAGKGIATLTASCASAVLEGGFCSWAVLTERRKVEWDDDEWYSQVSAHREEGHIERANGMRKKHRK